MAKSPAFRFYADDFVGGAVDMTPAEVGAYIRLLCYQWNRGSAPVDSPDKLALIAGCVVSDAVIAKFPGGKNPRLELERLKQSDFRSSQAAKGRRSAEARFNRGSTAVQPEGQPKSNLPFPFPLPLERTCLNAGARESSQNGHHPPQASEHSHTSKPGPSPKSPPEDPNIMHAPFTLPANQVSPNGNVDAERPSLDEVLTYAATIGLAPWKATDFHQEMEAAGWLDYRQRPIVAWRPALSRVKTKWEADGRPPSPPSTNRQHKVDATKPADQQPVGEAQRLFLAKDELSRVEASIKSIRGSYDDHQTMSIKDHARLKELKLRKAELTQVLGYRVS